MTRYPSPRRAPRLELELVSIGGGPTEPERAALEAALQQHLDCERRAAAPSLWLRAGRAQGRRLGMQDYRDRFSPEDVWRLSARLPAGGREYRGLIGRGDAR